MLGLLSGHVVVFEGLLLVGVPAVPDAGSLDLPESGLRLTFFVH